MEKKEHAVDFLKEKMFCVGEREYLFIFPSQISEERLQNELERLINEPAIISIDAYDVEAMFGDEAKVFVGVAECRDEDGLEQAVLSAFAMAKRGLMEKEPTKLLVMITGNCSFISVNDAVFAVQEQNSGNPPETIFEYCFKENETGELPVEVMVLVA